MIKKVEIKTNAKPYEDKQYEITLYLNHMEGYQDGCTGAWSRIVCLDNIAKYVDCSFSPVGGNQHILRGNFSLSKVTQSGYWMPQ